MELGLLIYEQQEAAIRLQSAVLGMGRLLENPADARDSLREMLNLPASQRLVDNPDAAATYIRQFDDMDWGSQFKVDERFVEEAQKGVRDHVLPSLPPAK